MPIFHSGAFLQQCFSVHPLSLNVKIVTLPEMVGVACVNCRMRHRLTIQPEAPISEENSLPNTMEQPLLSLHACSLAHAEEIRISLVDVVQDTVQFRCSPCRRTIALLVRKFETHQG